MQITHRTRLAGLVAFAAGGLLLGAGPAAAQEPDTFDFSQFPRQAVQKSIPLLQKSAGIFLGSVEKNCFSCHHQSLSVITFSLARKQGVAFDAAEDRKQVEKLKEFLALARPALEAYQTDPAAERRVDGFLVEPSLTLGYLLTPLHAAGMPADAATDAAVRYLLRKQTPEGKWSAVFARPPHTGSDFTTTALALRAIRAYPPKGEETRVRAAVDNAVRWLTTTQVRGGEDRTMRLFGLTWAGADAAVIRRFAQELADAQNDDGGWSQLPNLGSDAYATGQALVALIESGALPPNSPVLTRGWAHLVGTQKEDGSWKVAKRAVALQPYFDAGFPYEQDQFISYVATSWATMALMHAMPPKQAVAGK